MRRVWKWAKEHERALWWVFLVGAIVVDALWIDGTKDWNLDGSWLTWALIPFATIGVVTIFVMLDLARLGRKKKRQP